METIMVFDTETTGLDKCFCYDVGYVIYRKEGEEREVLCRHFVVEQVWHNLELFESAYYKEKRELYVTEMRAHRAIMQKWGYIMQTMIRDIEKYNVVAAYAYNSPFDDKVFKWNCDWFKTMNPFDSIPVYDIMGYASKVHESELYRQFCIDNGCLTKEDYISTSAESTYKFCMCEPDFSESHTGLDDAIIELRILLFCIDTFKLEWDTEYPPHRLIPAYPTKPFIVKVDGKVVINGEYVNKYHRGNLWSFNTKGK